MGVFFGTDGIRGIVNDNLNFKLAYDCGNALGQTKYKCKVLLGTDTRASRDYLKTAFASGIICAGGEVFDVGIIPTPGISYLTRTLGFDYGVVITASHNPCEYNGIKIFDSMGLKLGEKREEKLETFFGKHKEGKYFELGNYKQNPILSRKYEDFLVDSCRGNLKGKKIVLDLSNGAAYKIAPMVFKKLGARVKVINNKSDGLSINKNCGALHVEGLVKEVLKRKADVGFAYDGDADRLIAVDEKGEIVNGDKILLVFAKYLYKTDKLVITNISNIALDEELKNCGINTIRTDIGDKYVLEELIKRKLPLGGEQSGHIILRDLSETGDGILASIQLARVMQREDKPLSSLSEIDFYPQACFNIEVKDKSFVMDKIKNFVDKEQNEILGRGRILVRPSGTEKKIRVLVECKEENVANNIAEKIKKEIERLEKS